MSLPLKTGFEISAWYLRRQRSRLFGALNHSGGDDENNGLLVVLGRILPRGRFVPHRNSIPLSMKHSRQVNVIP
ncbi:hypothetical protein IF1G_09222 [Cordyceps javanica]|uniref:Uncharacterized protein n=1 Tax=Cordyceps javanica TaxID=43265 RepID=A0A545URS1_9HYPO|nr:hypothetical protein IF1G_09222 [Cordyceps javanica]